MGTPNHADVSPGRRVILHADMDAFFAAVEQLDFPHLRGKPVLVGGDGPRAVVCTASYEARQFGCHSALPMAIARRRCPAAIIQPVRGRRYGEVSKQVFEIFHRYTPLVEPLSIDEAFLDLTGSQRLHGDGPTIAKKIRAAIRAETGLTASVGVAHNKFLAKLASDENKPDGLTIVTPDMVDPWLGAMPISRLWGVGPATQAQLESMGVRKVSQLRDLTEHQLNRRFGDYGQRFYRLCRGLDDRPVVPDSDAKSIGQEQTFGVDIDSPDQVKEVLLGQVEQVARRLRRHEFTAKTVTVKIRYGDFHTITRSETLKQPTDTTQIIWDTARGLFETWARESFSPVRLVGVSAGGFAGEAQLGLFEEPENEKLKAIDKATDLINDRYGKNAISRAGGIKPRD